MRTGFLFFLIAFSFAVTAQVEYPDFWNNKVYFKVKDGSGVILPEYRGGDIDALFESYPEFAGWIHEYQVSEMVRPFHAPSEKMKRIYRITFNNPDRIDEFVSAVSRLSYVEYAEKCPVYRLFVTPNDTDITEQYFLTNIRAYDAWDIATGDKEIKVAIVDDACRITHPDLIGNIWRNYNEILGDTIDNDGNGYVDDFVGWDAADNDNNPNAPLNPPAIWGEMAFTHGTHCAGLAGAMTGNTTGIASVSHNVTIIPVKTVRNSSFIPLAIETPAEGVDYAIVAGADIVSMSFGGPSAASFNTLEIAINTGDSLGVVFVAAAGNDGDSTINYPAAFEKVIAVGATTSTDEKASFSQYGTFVDVMAPGAAMYSTLAWSSPYGPMDGTSMACPLTAGALALMKSYRPQSTPAELKFCLQQGCDNIDSLNLTFAGLMGAGRINVFNSLQCLAQIESIDTRESDMLLVYPNPATDVLFYESPFNSPVTIEIISVTGSRVRTFRSDESNGSISIADIKPGLYMICVSSQGRTVYRKISVTR